MDAAAPVSRAPSQTSASRAFLALAPVLLALVVAAQVTGVHALSALAMFVSAMSTSAALVLGVRRHRPHLPRPWLTLSLACGVFVAGAVARLVLDGSPLSPVADAMSLSGYGLTVYAFVSLLRGRGSVAGDRHELADGVIVMTAAAALAVAFLTVPTLTQTTLPRVYALVQGVYPLADVAVLGVILMLSWTTAAAATSFRLLAGAIAALLVGDVAYALQARQGELVAPPIVDGAFVLAFLLLGSAARHPSMAALSAVQQRPVQVWSPARLSVLAGCVVLPAALRLRPEVHPVELAVLGGCSTVMLGALLVRAVGAVHGHNRVQDVLRHRATHDPLTGLADRWHLATLVTELLEEADRVGGHVEVVCLDLDGFQHVNESWGHALGDALLVEAAARLESVAAPGDVVARTDGDQFVLARLARDGGPTPPTVAAELLEAYRRPLPFMGRWFVVTASLGTAVAVPSADTEVSATAVLQEADTAMHRAKVCGKNRAVAFDPSMHAAVRSRLELEMELRGALDRGEMDLHYQPVVRLSDGRAEGFEALLRWRHPQLGDIPPLDFVGIAEETGLIEEIGRWVIERALAQLAEWSRPDLTMAVNLSPRQLGDAGLVDHVHAALDRSGVDPRRLTLEITESVLAADADALAVVRRLRGLGISVSIDDFGTGYSSLAHLRRFPVQVLKVDRSFVSGVAEDAGAEAIVRAIVALAHEMGLAVVAEGVETAAQAQTLRAMGVESAQGWLFGRPTAAAAVSLCPAPTTTPRAALLS
jgi:diguanylate cyclase (GGDEF)-like protein